MPALEEPPERLKPMTEKAPAMSWLLGDDGLRAVGQCAGIGQRRARRRLHDDHQVALILLGMKPVGTR